ncbi:hypothetical protein I547_6412 [Mycobacterium kansasii 824]|nr:hypothetical protein I547_6412 [Mycobacterium kansasii 824]
MPNCWRVLLGLSGPVTHSASEVVAPPSAAPGSGAPGAGTAAGAGAGGGAALGPTGRHWEAGYPGWAEQAGEPPPGAAESRLAAVAAQTAVPD